MNIYTMPTKKILLDFLKCIAKEYNTLAELNIIDLEPRVRKVKPKPSLIFSSKRRKKRKESGKNKKKAISAKRKNMLLTQIKKLEKKLNSVPRDNHHIKKIKALERTLSRLKKKVEAL